MKPTESEVFSITQKNASENTLSLKKLKGNILLVDVETTDNDRVIIEISGKVLNKYLLPIHTFSYIIAETWESEKRMSGEYATLDKVNAWKDNIKYGKSQLLSAKTIASEMNNLFSKYDVSVICAYNLSFDIDAMIKTFRHYGVSVPQIAKVQKLDLWLYASVIFIKQRYVNFCVSNNYLTKSKNCLTNAEVVYKYISNDNTFIESHVAIDDVNIELDILRTCALYNGNPKINAYQRPQSYIKQMEKYFK